MEESTRDGEPFTRKFTVWKASKGVFVLMIEEFFDKDVFAEANYLTDK